ncbi:isochorismatase family protein, partial [Actinophytocola sp.]|uniref:isochorismatase family protein n=1 Tax=Actinophytocola sp. TaxID=1872138 RepID=UPI002ED77D31
ELIPAGRTALVLQEVQNGVVGVASVFPALAAAAAEVGVARNAARLAVAARAAGVPVVHATAENLSGGFGANRNARLFAAARKAGADNTPGTSSVRPLAMVHDAGDVILPRYHGLSPMADGQLDALLRNTGITSIVVAGVSLNVAIPNLVFDAVNRAYRVVVVTDAVAGVPLEFGARVLEHTVGLIATLATADEVVTTWSAREGR